MSQPPPAYLKLIRILDRITEMSGYLFALLLIPLILSNAVEVFMRYVLDSPTVWALETTVMSYGALFMLGAAYALLKGAHVRTDMFWEKFSDRKKGLIDSITYVLLFLPSMGLLFYMSFDELHYAWSIGERSNLTAWPPPRWPLRAVVPLSALLLFLQGLSELLKSLWAVRTGAALVRHQKIEL
ncbi:MAG: TRAP transporter small permease subunit [Prolixibacteraceae bacterium]|nr:TRAP transporter small permease subunit [Burkholderiales bacterium]